MTAPLALPGLEQAAGVVCEHLDRGQRRVTLYGRASSGKTSTIGLIAGLLQASDWRVHRTQMTSDDDGALVALAMLGADLGDDVRSQVFDVTVPWKRKLQAVVHGLERTGGRTAVLVDDPWFGSPEEAPSLFAERSVDLLDEIERTPSLSLVLSRSDRPLAGTFVELPTAADPHAVLAAERWQRSSLEGVARELAESSDAKLARLSPVELRLAVALASVRGMNAAEAHRRLRTGPHAFVRAVLDALSSARFRKAIVRLGVMRTPFDEATLDALLGETSAHERGLVLDAFVFRTDDGFVVPELLARVAKERLPTLSSAELKQAHLVAVGFHERGFAEHSAISHPVDLRVVKRHEMEIIHHFTEVGDAEAVFRRSVYFVEQYDKLGKTLSLRGIRMSRPALLGLAVDAYDRALAHDHEDAYAHHYRAYNLDVLAQDPGPVEAGYRRALTLRPDHVWHHGRYISFLVTCGRAREAHDVWDEALRTLDGLRGHAWLFRELHRPVARLLLHRGRLELAREVLDDVPERLGDTWLPPTRALLAQLEEAEADQLVFPASVPPEDRWKGPHLLVAEEERVHVVRWMPGRIESANGEIIVRFAEYAERTATFGRRTYTAAKFRRACPAAKPTMPAAGTFLEIIELDGDDHEVIRCHPMTTTPNNLPQLFPPPDRYL